MKTEYAEWSLSFLCDNLKCIQKGIINQWRIQVYDLEEISWNTLPVIYTASS